MLVIGIDPSLTGTAICALDKESSAIIKVITLNPAKDCHGINRLAWIAKNTLHTVRVICDKTDKSSELFIEGFAFGARGRGIFDLGELGGILRLMLAEKFGGYYEVPPTSLKKFVCGKGNAPKQIMLEQTFRKWGLGSDTLTDDNMVDAYGLARMGAKLLQYKANPTVSITKLELDAINGIGEKQVLI